MGEEKFREVFHKRLGITDAYKAPSALMEILYDKEEREEMFKELLKVKKGDLTYDWFNDYFQEEHAERKSKKQDFTPRQIADILAEITGPSPKSYYEVAAGTGSILVRQWANDIMGENIFTYNPSDWFYTVEELSDRTVPFLAFNMMIRGMNGVIIHGDAINRTSKGVLFIQNFENDFMKFSDLNVFPYTESIETEFDVRFTEKGYYKEHVERSWPEERKNGNELSEWGKEVLEIIHTMEG